MWYAREIDMEKFHSFCSFMKTVKVLTCSYVTNIHLKIVCVEHAFVNVKLSHNALSGYTTAKL